MNKIIGIDANNLKINAISLNKGNDLEKISFNEIIHSTTEIDSPSNQEKSEYKSSRKQLQRRKKRLNKLINVVLNPAITKHTNFNNYDELIEHYDKKYLNNVYEKIKYKAIKKNISFEEFIILIFAYARKRGTNHNIKVNKEIEIDKFKSVEIFENFVKNNLSTRNHTITQKEIKIEFDFLLKKYKNYFDFLEISESELKTIVFFKKPLKSQKFRRYRCEINNTKYGKIKTHPYSELFIVLTDLKKIKVNDKFLTTEQEITLLNEILKFKKQKYTIDQLKKILGLTDKDILFFNNKNSFDGFKNTTKIVKFFNIKTNITHDNLLNNNIDELFKDILYYFDLFQQTNFSFEKEYYNKIILSDDYDLDKFESLIVNSNSSYLKLSHSVLVDNIYFMLNGADEFLAKYLSSVKFAMDENVWNKNKEFILSR